MLKGPNQRPYPALRYSYDTQWAFTPLLTVPVGSVIHFQGHETQKARCKSLRSPESRGRVAADGGTGTASATAGRRQEFNHTLISQASRAELDPGASSLKHLAHGFTLGSEVLVQPMGWEVTY